MNLSHHMTRYAAALVCAVALIVSGCSNSFIFDDEGDCDPNYRVRFHYNYHLKKGDAFPHEVTHVTLNVIDEEGRIVHTHHESGDALSQDGYEVVLDDLLPPGKYRLHAWCGAGAMPGSQSFAIHDAENVEDLKCTLLPDPDGRATPAAGAEGTAVHRQIENLYHGYTQEVTMPEDEGTHYYDVDLMKNTNDIVVTLAQLSPSSSMDDSDFEYVIVAGNARLDHDNSVIAADKVTYHAHHSWGGSIDLGTNESTGQSIGVFNSVQAEFRVSRLMADEDVRLNIYRKATGDLICSLNIVEYALKVRTLENRAMDDQEYLDRQDQYTFAFFLDNGYRWINSYIYVNSWKIILQEADL